MAGSKRDTYKYRQTKVAAKQVTITLTDQNKIHARELSKAMFGRMNVSHLISFLIEEQYRRHKEEEEGEI